MQYQFLSFNLTYIVKENHIENILSIIDEKRIMSESIQVPIRIFLLFAILLHAFLFSLIRTSLLGLPNQVASVMLFTRVTLRKFSISSSIVTSIHEGLVQKYLILVIIQNIFTKITFEMYCINNEINFQLFFIFPRFLFIDYLQFK